ncbi:MAG TPA: CVNH domain-containing protein [Candidatus Angelobacter sp.]|nr:CVNH domain-containing protein [Candidatus Angelobacter sp.]
MYRIILCAVALLPFGLLSPAAAAQGQWDHDRDHYQGGQGNYGGPGSFQDSCTDAHWDGSVLYARCQKRDGGWRNTSIDSRNCGAQILNLDGRLSCGQADNGYPNNDARAYDRQYDNNRGYYGGQANQGGLPPGDYQLTCQDMRINGDRLYASCQKRDGRWRNTSLDDFDRCNSPIVNDNGRLRCSR